MLRSIAKEDCSSIVQIHLTAFNGFFLTFLGPRFLYLFYRGLISDPTGIAILYQQDEQILGFVVGTTNPKGFYQRLIKRHAVSFAFASFPALLRDIKIFPRLVRSFRKPNANLPKPNCTMLMSIAVMPDIQKKGVGKELVKAFFIEAKLRGSMFVNLTTDYNNNEHVNKFYSSLGFEIFRQYSTSEGRLMNEYLIKL